MNLIPNNTVVQLIKHTVTAVKQNLGATTFDRLAGQLELPVPLKSGHTPEKKKKKGKK